MWLIWFVVTFSTFISSLTSLWERFQYWYFTNYDELVLQAGFSLLVVRLTDAYNDNRIRILAFKLKIRPIRKEVHTASAVVSCMDQLIDGCNQRLFPKGQPDKRFHIGDHLTMFQSAVRVPAHGRLAFAVRESHRAASGQSTASSLRFLVNNSGARICRPS